jgi:hypothetical protein
MGTCQHAAPVGEPGSDVSRFRYLLYPGLVPFSTDKNLVATLFWHYVAADVGLSVWSNSACWVKRKSILVGLA